jgi:hypothetical protein
MTTDKLKPDMSAWGRYAASKRWAVPNAREKHSRAIKKLWRDLKAAKRTVEKQKDRER